MRLQMETDVDTWGHVEHHAVKAKVHSGCCGKILGIR